MGFKQEGETVTLTLSRDDFNGLLMVLGVATGVAFGEGNTPLARSWLRLANRINEGNPNYTPYQTEPAIPVEKPVENPVEKS